MGEVKNPNVTEILTMVHDRMNAKYNPSSKFYSDAKEAKILQDFLFELKSHAMKRKDAKSSENVSNDIYDIILDNTLIIGKKGRKRGVEGLFTRLGNSNKDRGTQFEDDLGAVIASVVNLATGKTKYTQEHFSLGDVAGTTDIDFVNSIEQTVEEETKILARNVGEEISKNQPGWVLGKIDTYVDGTIVNINGTIEFPPGVLEALSNATFSDKSYRSKRWDAELDSLVDVGDKIIHLGQSNPYRAVLGVMSNLKFSKQDAQYVYYAGINIYRGLDRQPPPERSEIVKEHIYHMRYIYELTGTGILYKEHGSKFSSGAKFLVYNDPDSAIITVVATSQIIYDLLNKRTYPDNPFGLIGIHTSALEKMANVQR